MVLQDIEVSVAMNISKGTMGALNVDDMREFDVVEFLSDVFLQENDERMVEVKYWKLLSKGGHWYIPTNETGIQRVMHIVVADIQLNDISADNTLPRGFPQGVPPCQILPVPEQNNLQNNLKYWIRQRLCQK